MNVIASIFLSPQLWPIGLNGAPRTFKKYIYSKRKSIIGTVMEWIRAFLPQNTILVSAIINSRHESARGPIATHASQTQECIVMYLCSVGSFGLRRLYTEVRRPMLSVGFCTPTAAAAAVGTVASSSPLLSVTSPPTPRFCAEDLLKLCSSTLRRGQASTCH